MTTSKTLAYLRLLRLPNVFTAIADVLMGYLVAGGALAAPAPLVCVAAGSALMYLAGMVLNDVFDVEIDRRERPERPLPSGAISMGVANRLGWSMLLIGAALGAGAAWIAPTETSWTSAVVAVLLAGCIVLYDGVLKQTVAGPWTMGACRTLNVLLGMSVPAADAGRLGTLYFNDAELAIALGLGLYVAGVTWFARTEAEESGRGMLAWGLFWMTAGLALLTQFPQFEDYESRLIVGEGAFTSQWSAATVWTAIVVILAIPVARRCLAALAAPSPPMVQAAVKQAILSLIFFDAAVAFALTGVAEGLLIVSLIVPSLLLGRWVYST